MIKKKYRISELAIGDLEKIWLYTFKNWSLEQADRYHNLLLDEIEFISCNFKLGKNMEHIRTGYRMSKMKSHLIFYKMGKNDVIEIIRILHQQMDIEKRLEEKKK